MSTQRVSWFSRRSRPAAAKRSAGALIVLMIALAGCAPKTASEVKTGKPVEPTVQAIMDTQVDPSADTIWASVGTVETKAGAVQRQPSSDQAWFDLRKHAARLIEGARLLQAPRTVGGDGHGALADASTPGIRTAAQIQADIRADPARFAQAAARLERAGVHAQAAIDGKDQEALIVAGADIDAACEACHAAYWYPRTPPKTLPAQDAFARTASRP